MKDVTKVQLSLVLTIASPAIMAEVNNKASMVEIRLAGQAVPVMKGGLYDRYRSNTPLSVIATESPGTDLSWFKTLQKKKVDIGFESWSPNFYYENTKVTALYTADLDRLAELVPPKVLEVVQPLQVWPGRGLVALTGYAYHYCDNDSYNEISLAVVTNKPGKTGLGAFSLMGQAISKDFWGYVLKLPVDTELAKVRGVVGYNLPKWRTGIHYSENEHSLSFSVIDQTTGLTEVIFETAKLNDVSETPSMVTNSFTNIDQTGNLTYGHAVSRQLKYGSSMRDENVKLSLGSGEFARFIKSLELGEMVRYDYVPDFQSALYAPRPLSTLMTATAP